MPYVECKICDNKFYVKPSHLRYGFGKYCSRKCQAQGQKTGKFVSCNICHKKIWRIPKDLKNSKSGKYFCSKSCQTQWRNKYYSGKRHPNWKTGEHQEYRKHLLVKGVKPVCKICSTDDLRVLVAHHIDCNRTNNKVNNLVWLCLNCHFLVHYHNQKLVL